VILQVHIIEFPSVCLLEVADVSSRLPVPTVAQTAALRPSDGKRVTLVESMPSLAEIVVPRPVSRIFKCAV